MPFAPRPILRSAGYHTVGRNESLTSIAASYRQPESSYRDLVAANPNKPLRFAGMPRGSSATFASLREGERLRLPWFWFAGKNAGNVGLLPPGMVGDVQSDALSAAIKTMFGVSYAPAEEIDAIANMVSLLWKQDHPGHELPSGDKLPKAIAPYVSNAKAWWSLYGKSLPPSVAASVPWSETPWVAWARAIGQGLQPKFIEWADVNDYLEKHASIGAGAPQGGVSFHEEVLWKGTVPGTNTPWSALEYGVTPQVRFDLFPLDKIDFTGIPQNKTKAATDWLLQRLSGLVMSGAIDEAKPGGGGGYQLDPNVLKHLPKPTDPQPCPAGQVWADGRCYPMPTANGCGQGFDLTMVGGKPVCIPHQNQPASASAGGDSSVPVIIAVGGVAIGLIALYLANRK